MLQKDCRFVIDQSRHFQRKSLVRPSLPYPLWGFQKEKRALRQNPLSSQLLPILPEESWRLPRSMAFFHHCPNHLCLLEFPEFEPEQLENHHNISSTSNRHPLSHLDASLDCTEDITGIVLHHDVVKKLRGRVACRYLVRKTSENRSSFIVKLNTAVIRAQFIQRCF